MKKILGIDVGTNSIGWAVTIEEGEPQILGLGSRIFQEAVNPKDRTPKNAKRRAKRMLRKIIRRRAQRKRALTILLQKNGLLPERGAEWDRLFDDHKINPYVLRRKALDEKISLSELGRVLFHLAGHRGFKSNRKAMLSSLITDPDVAAVIAEEEAEKAANPKKSKEEDEGVVLKAIAELQQQIQGSGARTLGEFLANQLDAGGRARRGDGETANVNRDMVETEFEAIWEAQTKHHRQLTDQLKARVYQTIFFQRPLKVQRSTIEECPFEKGRARAMKAQVISQRFRIAQVINNIRLESTTLFAQSGLSEEQRIALRDELEKTQELKWKAIRKVIKDKDSLINYEEAGEEKLLGNKTSCRIRARIPELWDTLDEKQQDALVHDLIHTDRVDGVIKRLRKHWHLTPQQAYKLATTEFDSGTASLSAKAMRKLLAHMEKGMRYDEACVEVYGKKDPLTREGTVSELPPPKDPRNPVVFRAMHELRKVVNAIQRHYGPLDQIRIEMARDLKLTKKEKDEIAKQNKKNQKLNETALEALKTLQVFQGGNPSRDDLEKYRLWAESNEMCPYTGRKVSLSELYSGDYDVEHIIPYSRCWDDSFQNKTICYAPFNRATKKNKTPKEALSSEELDKVMQRLHACESMRRGKRDRFTMDWNDDQSVRFLNRQLNDTAYIARYAKEYLAQLVGETNVQVSKGSSTALLRHRWGLENVLGSETKNREDHRHHAVDALVVALTSRSLFQLISKLSGQHGGASLRERGFDLPSPIPNLRDEAIRWLVPLLVSHQTNRKVFGAYHEDTAYGKIAEGLYVYRKAVNTLTPGEIDRVRDRWLREKLKAIGSEELKKRDPATPFEYLDKYGRRRLVRRVRLTKNLRDESMADFGYKHHPKGSNHHVEVFENADGERRYRVVSTFDAAKRIQMRKPIVDKHYPGGFEFLTAWHANDVVTVEGRAEVYYKIVKFSANDPEGQKSVMVLLRPLRRATESTNLYTPDRAGPYEDVLCQSAATNRVIGPVLDLSVLGHLK